MSTYYQYEEVKRMIAHRLMAMDGWKVYGYKPDESDIMTDYYSPASWSGVAEKNGYILCVDVHGAADPYEVKRFNYEENQISAKAMEKIKKLQEMTIARGASPAEEESAKKAIETLKKATEKAPAYTVVEVIPAHQAHPPRCNWHIEKNGLIIAKGAGILKYADVYKYESYPHYSESMQEFRKNPARYTESLFDEYMACGYYTDKEKARESAEHTTKNMQKDSDMLKAFDKFMNKIDTTCGGLIGDGELEQYEKIIVTEYKKELQVIETSAGKIREGQLFTLKTNFNYGCRKGFVYRIHERESNGKKFYHAYKLNGKLTKECTGRADSSNCWYGINEDFLSWIEKGSIAWCELQEVDIPYEVEKVVKKAVKKADKPQKENAAQDANTPADLEPIEYTLEESEHTKTKEKLWLVRIKTDLSKQAFVAIRKRFADMHGYYSKFTHSFIFKHDPENELADLRKVV